VALAVKREKPISQIARTFGPMDLGISEKILSVIFAQGV
jgi:hypothetical protein